MKKTTAVLLAALMTTTMAGCMGRNAMSKSVQDFNMDHVQNRWGREGMFILLFPVSYVTNILDLFIVNSIEFWSGTNPINGKEALVDSKVSTAALEKMGIHDVASATMRHLDNEMLMYVSYTDGSKEVFHATRADGVYSFYRGKELVIQVKEEQLKDLQAAIRAKMETYASAKSDIRKS